MTKRISILLMIVSVLIITLCSCSNKDNDLKVQPDVKKLKDDIIKSLTLPEMLDSSDETIEISYSEIDLTKFDSYAFVAAGSPVSAEEVAVVKVKSSGDVDGVKAVFEDRVKDRASVFGGYAPLEADKLNRAIIKTKGNYIFLAVCDEPEKAEKIFDDAFKQ